MKKVVLSVICFALVLGCLMLAGPRVSAAEPDLDMEDHVAWRDRLMEADLAVVFATIHHTDGFYSSLITNIMLDRFAEAPYEFAEALALESAELQEEVFCRFEFEAELFPYLLTIANLLDPSELGNPEAQQALVKLQEAIRQSFSSSNPGTGDSIGIFAGLMAVSGLAAAALVWSRKKTA